MNTFLRELFELYAKRLLTGKVRPSISEEGIMTIPNNKRVKLMAENLYKDFKKAGVPDDILKTENDIKVFHHKIADFNNAELEKKLGTFEDVFAPKKSADIIDFPPERITDWTKARPQPPTIEVINGIQTTRGMGDLFEKQMKNIGRRDLPEIPKPTVAKETDAQIIARIKKQNKEAAERLRNKKDPDEPEGFYQGGQAQIEPDLSNIGHGSDALMARNMLIAPGSQATTSTGLNYLLGEDNDTTRVPYGEGEMVLPKPKPESAKTKELLEKVMSQAGVNTLTAETRQMLIEELKEKLRNENSQAEGGVAGLLGEGPRSTDHGPRNFNGGRIGLAEGDTPSQAWMRDNFYKSGYDDSGVITLDNYINGGQGWRDYMDHGPGKANGGRIGYEEGRTVGNIVDIRNLPYYGAKGVEAGVNATEWGAKGLMSLGELGSKLIRQKPTKKMFSEALDNMEPGAWSEKLGLSSLIEGMEKNRSPEAQTAGNLLGLGTEMALPIGGGFKIGKKLFKEGADILKTTKTGKNLEKLIDKKLTDLGQSRRDFNKTVAAGGMVVALKSIGLGSLAKKTNDIGIKMNKHIVDEDVDYGVQGLMNFDFVGKTQAGKEFIKKFFKGKKDISQLDPEDAVKLVKEAKKLNLLSGVDDLLEEGNAMVKNSEPTFDYYKNWPKVFGSAAKRFKRFKDKYRKQTKRENIEEFAYDDGIYYRNDDWVRAKDTPGSATIRSKEITSPMKEFIELVEPIK